MEDTIVGNLDIFKQDWIPVCTDNFVVIPTEHPVIIMENKTTHEHAYFDVKYDRFLSQQEAFDVIRGFR